MKRSFKKLGRFVLRTLGWLGSGFDKAYHSQGIPMSQVVSHANWQKYLYQMGNMEGLRILEIESREVTGQSVARKQFAKAEYIGFDYYSGGNVDVVGDAHRLSSYFKEDEKFDIIYSSACFEHFAMPWLVSVEIAKLLKVGGTVFVETHFSYSAHERPWNFFQFSDMGLRVLFSSALGFECIEAGMSNPMIGRYSALADKYLRYQPISELFCHSEYLGRKVREVQSFDWYQIALDEVTAGTTYPTPNQ